MKKLPILLLFLLLAPNLIGQDSARVYFYFPHNNEFDIRVDEDSIYHSIGISLSEGLHVVEIWVPGLDIITDTIQVSSKTSNVFKYTSKVTKEYRQYKTEKRQYHGAIIKMTIPPTFLLLSLAANTYFYVKARQLQTDYYLVRENYPTSIDPVFLSEAQQNLNNIYDDYQYHRRNYYFSLGSTFAFSVLTGIVARRFDWSLKKPQPTFLDSPFRQSSPTKLSLDYSVNTFKLCLTF